MMLKAKDVESSVIRETGGDFSISEVLRELEAEMSAAAASLEYERAALLRDQIMELKNGTGISKIEPKKRPTKVSYSKGSRNGADIRHRGGRRAARVEIQAAECRTGRKAKRGTLSKVGRLRSLRGKTFCHAEGECNKQSKDLPAGGSLPQLPRSHIAKCETGELPRRGGRSLDSFSRSSLTLRHD